MKNNKLNGNLKTMSKTELAIIICIAIAVLVVLYIVLPKS